MNRRTHTHGYTAYLRVSTEKQGTTGVSLEEQRLAIELYAEKHALSITSWRTETRTAGKVGRPVFKDILHRLRRGEAAGVIIHRIDRGTRNLWDWAALSELLDLGVDVRFAHDDLDLHSRGGRLAADIQAVVAADFVRNIKEETRKGILGRLRQGFYPLPAPLGYLNNGGGKPKTPDPETAEHVKAMFRMYETGTETITTLQRYAYRIGLRNVRGEVISQSGVSRILRNPFYAGIIRLPSIGHDVQGQHQALVPLTTWHAVQQILDGRRHDRPLHHNFRFRGLVVCTRCNHTLVGEKHRSRVYYRCHGKECKGVCFSEEQIDLALGSGVWPTGIQSVDRRTTRFAISNP